MVCNTKTLTEDGKQEYKYKKSFDTLDKAIAEAKKQNARDDHDMKLVGYKCTYCHLYHIGRNGKLITPKEKAKLKAELKAEEQAKLNKGFKVVGWIDLDKIRY